MTKEKGEEIRDLLNKIDDCEKYIQILKDLRHKVNQIEATNFKLCFEYQLPIDEETKIMIANTSLEGLYSFHHEDALDNLNKTIIITAIDFLIRSEEDRLQRLNFMLVKNHV